MQITHIKQRGDWDCGVAALAMAVGISYEAAHADLSPTMTDGRGVNDLHLKDWLIEHGWAWQEVTQNHPVAGHYVKRDPWPPKPFAPSHIALVLATKDYHFTVMDSAGQTFDPWNAARTSLAHPEYRNVNWVMGLWPVAVVG